MKRSVLVVDDDDSVRKSILRVLLAEGFVAIGAHDADNAQQLALQCVPDLLIMDLQLPRMSGNEAVLRLRTHSKLRDIPVIALSATPEQAVPSLFDAVLRKPCSTDVLLEAIKDALERTRQTREYTSAGQSQPMFSRRGFLKNY